jgi:hypothetical protein
VAEELIRWIDGGAADGFILGFPVAAQGLDDFIDFVIPELEKRGRYDRVLHGATLRDHLGLPFKESRHKTPAASAPKGNRHERPAGPPPQHCACPGRHRGLYR